MTLRALAAIAAIGLALTVGGYAQDATPEPAKVEAPAPMTGPALEGFLQAVIAAQTATIGSQNTLAALQGTPQYKAYIDAATAARRADATLQALIDKHGAPGWLPNMDGTWRPAPVKPEAP